MIIRRTLLTRIAAIAITLVLSACTSYKLTPTDNYQVKPVTNMPSANHSGSDVQVIKINRGPEGWQCFEPMMYVLTVGILPAHCLDRFHIASADTRTDSENELATHFEYSAIQGWVTLILVMSPRWQLGSLDNPEEEILRIVEQQRL